MLMAPHMRLGPYETLSLIGEGGMGEVWKARDTRLRRIVAIKVSKEEFSERSEREARAVAALNHPHICQIYDVGPNYLVMEYIEGKRLRGPLAPEETLRLGVQISGALEEAHAHGILHRDLKPENILVTAKGVAKLLDFGLAKMNTSIDPEATHTEQAIDRTNHGALLGTPAFMSPEQVRGERIDARSDVFSLGAVLYEMHTGTRAFQGNSFAEILSSVLRDDPAPFTGFDGLSHVVKRCLQKDRADRYQTVAEVHAALQGLSHSETRRQPSVAVLPFANMSGDPENAYFSDGLAEEIINALTKLKGLRVIARASAFRFRGEPDLHKIGQALRVEHVLQGSVRRAGNRLRVTAQLIEILDDSLVWSERYDRDMSDVFAVQDEISQAIVDILQVQLVAGQFGVIKRKTTSVEAYNAFLEGRYYLQQFTDAGFTRARQCFMRAIKLDPYYGLPYGGLADGYVYASLYHPVPTTESRAQALAAAEQCIQLDPNAAEGYMARALVQGPSNYNWASSEEDFERAVQLNPGSAVAFARRGLYSYMPMRRMEEASADIQRAVELDPLSVLMHGLYAFMQVIFGRPDAAVREAHTTLELHPNVFLSCFVAGFALVGARHLDEALAVIDHGLEVAPGNVWLMALKSAALGHTRKQDAAREILGFLQDRAATKYVPSLALGVVHAASGNLDEAFQLLDGAIDERQPWTVLFLMAPAVADFLLGPRYNDLFHRMNLPAP